ncbi:hypothetical protein DFH08DRAFT_814659 [Mycena albidolilacea]|uniref:Uncharacterized protein n=1 Tax=Mycena albidolilacea TaxID=1033008 RepID=A0AAD6ZNK4_9AGAR|nr:hypothetical protein DFH08DRAFT_814659 [Mycena albidolilacea]
MFLVLHCYLLQHGPLPISIWLLLCLIQGKQALLIPQNTLLHIDPGVHAILAPWYDFHVDTLVLPASEPFHPLGLFIIKYMGGMQPNLISNTRTIDKHNGWLISAFATVLLGSPAPWEHPEYLALRAGFNKAFGTVRFASTLGRLRASAFLVTIYDRRVHTVEEVADHLRFWVASHASDSTTPYYAKLFMVCLQHYISGVGHLLELHSHLPAHSISEEEIARSSDDCLLRANLILCCGTDSDLRPTDDNCRISFRFYGSETRDSVIGSPLGFHSCFQAIDVHLDNVLTGILMEPVGADERAASSFDLWLHEQVVNPEHNTNAPVSYASAPLDVPDSSNSEDGAENPFGAQPADAHTGPDVQSREMSVEVVEQDSVLGDVESDGAAIDADDDGDEIVSLETDPDALQLERAFMREVDVELPIAQIHRLQGPNADTELPSTVCVGPEPSQEEHIPVVYFVGIQTPQGCRSFVDVVQGISPDHTLFTRFSDWFLCRALEMVRNDKENYHIGNANMTAYGPHNSGRTVGLADLYGPLMPTENIGSQLALAWRGGETSIPFLTFWKWLKGSVKKPKRVRFSNLGPLGSYLLAADYTYTNPRLVAPPTLENLGTAICMMNKGAIAGLEILELIPRRLQNTNGDPLLSTPEACVRGLEIVHSALCSHWTSDIQSEVWFNLIMIEHSLCKFSQAIRLRKFKLSVPINTCIKFEVLFKLVSGATMDERSPVARTVRKARPSTESHQDSYSWRRVVEQHKNQGLRKATWHARLHPENELIEVTGWDEQVGERWRNLGAEQNVRRDLAALTPPKLQHILAGLKTGPRPPPRVKAESGGGWYDMVQARLMEGPVIFCDEDESQMLDMADGIKDPLKCIPTDGINLQAEMSYLRPRRCNEWSFPVQMGVSLAHSHGKTLEFDGGDRGNEGQDE